jgi:thymidylate kinase
MSDQRITELARILEGLSIEYCILHGWDAGASCPNSDVDIAVAPKDLRAFEKALDNNSFGGIAQLLHYESTGYFFIVRLPTRHITEFAKCDVGTDYRHGGLVYLSGADLLKNRRKWHDVWTASPESEFAYLLVKRICKQRLSARQANRFHELQVELDERKLVVCRKLLGPHWAKRVVGWIASSDWTAFETNLHRLRRALHWKRLISDPLNPLRYWLPEAMRLQQRLRYPTGLLVAVLGPDGAGKTTLIEGLRRELSGTFRSVQTFRFRPDIFGRNLPGPEPYPHGKCLRSRSLSILKVLYLWGDYALGYLINVRSKLIRSDLVIFDRYYDDILVDPIRYRYGGPRWLIKFVRHLIPRPDITLILDASEDQMLARKTELPREELRRQRIAYRQLAAGVPNTVMLDASRPAAEVVRQASECCLRYLHSRYLKRRRLWFGTPSDIASKGDRQQSLGAAVHAYARPIAETEPTTTQASVFHQEDFPQ